MLAGRRSFITALCVGAMVLIAQASEAQQTEKGRLAAEEVRKIDAALGRFQRECKLSILQENLPGDVSCGHGPETIGEAWNRTLAAEGVPEATEDRRRLASQLGLDGTASLVFVSGMARAEGIQYLLKSLKSIAGQTN